MRRLAPILILAVGACAVGPGAEAVFPNRALVPHPEALFDVAPRSAALGANNASNGQPRGVPFCPRPKDLVEYQPLLAASLAAMEAGPAYSKAPRDFARALNGSAYRVLLDQDMGRAAEAIAALRAHAERNAWLPKGQEWSAAGAVIEGMGPLLPAWQILRQTSAATDADRQTIDGWLRRLAAYAAIHPGENNIGSFRGANDMLLGLMLGDDALYQQGLRSGFVRQLGAMRADGSFPMEADRGRTALQNTSRNIALLVYAAEIAGSQGQDLWSMRINGRGLEDAVGFLLSADADPALVDQYAQANRNPNEKYPVFAPASQVSPWDNSAKGWIKLYTDHFPRSAQSQALLAKVDLPTRINQDTVGGYVTCYASRL
ncbi:MAG: alginate lyase family protein [Amaricoccus sp.]